MLPMVSVVVITYNHERWVREALDSIFAQGHPADRLQVVVLDNGSTDATPRILAEEYADRVDELILLDPGLPLNDAVNLGQSKATGELFTGLSGDDAWLPGRLQAMLDLFERRPDAGVVYGDMQVIDEHGALAHPSWRAAFGLPVNEGRMFGRLLERNLVFAPAVLMRGELRPALLPIPAHAAWEDWWFATTAARVTEIAYLDAPVTRYRRHGGALSNASTPERETAFLREDVRFRGWLLQTLAPGEATPEELATAVVAQIDGALRLAALTRRTPASALAIGGRERRAAHAEERRARQIADPVARMTFLARAVGHDPTDAKLAARFSAAAGDADGTGAPSSPVHPASVVADAHDRVTLVRAEELLGDGGEALLAGRAAAEHETLAIFGPGADAVALAARLDAGAPDADAVLIDLPDTPTVRAALAVRATSLLTSDPAPGWPWEGIRRAHAEPRPAVATV